MEIADHARRHGVADDDIHHAVRNATHMIHQSEGDRVLYIGPDRSGRPLQVVVLDDDVAIHAMPLQRKFQIYVSGSRIEQ